VIRSLRTTLNPACYHGHRRTPPFFEGWYYKLVDASEEHRYAVIPGVFLSEDPDNQHAFVQVLDGRTGHSAYHSYPADAFWAADGTFDLHIGPNRFTAERVLLDIESPEIAVRGELRFHGLTPWPVTLASPGIMGWYAWVPFMECYHGVVSLDHQIEGALSIQGRLVEFGGGRGYIEKDWGQAFPAAWIWYQTNHFARPGTSLTASVAIIPWVRRSFPGFIIGLWHAGHLYRFATYTGARIERLDVADEQVSWVVRNRRYRLEMRATRPAGGLLQAPTTVDMGRRIAETLDAEVAVALYGLEGDAARLLFHGVGRHAGLEAVGDLARLRAMWASSE
jgi:tocopherol cyclase